MKDDTGSQEPVSVDVWILDLCSPLPDFSEDYPFLAKEELAKARNYVFPQDRVHALRRAVFRRRVLARYLEVPPGELSFAYGRYGKPRLLSPLRRGVQGWSFNLSHSKTISVLGVVRAHNALGIDVEYMDAETVDNDLIEQSCSETEQKVLYRLPPGQRVSTFWRLWTAKEAYLKALGIGLSRDPRKVCFSPQSVRYPQRPLELLGNPHWRFLSFEPCARFLCTLALETAVPLKVRKCMLYD